MAVISVAENLTNHAGNGTLKVHFAGIGKVKQY